MPEARRKKTLRALAGAVIAAALVVTPMVTAGAVAEVAATQEGQVGVLQPWTQETNHVEYWQGEFPGATCVKGEASTGNLTVSDTGKSITLKAAPTGQQWVALIIKAGNLWNNVVANPQVGVAYASPDNNGDQQAVVSHWFACYTTAVPETPEKPAPLSTQDVKTTFECGSDETITTTTTTTDWVWDAVSGAWVLGTPVTSDPVVTHAALTAAELQTCQSDTPPPTTTVTYTDWTDGVWVCGDTTVTQTRTKTTTVTPSEGEPTVTNVTETRTRDLTHDEIGTCPLTPGDITSECVGDVPYLSYAVSLPAGFVPVQNPSTPLTITFVNPNKGGVDYVIKALPLKGEILWPGASSGTPKMWPGWEIQNGEYVKTTGNFDWTRQGVTVRFDVNPTYSKTVTYPKATALCASPSLLSTDPTPNPTTDPSSTPTPTATGTPLAASGDDLASTGGTGVSPILVTGGVVALAAGIAGVVIAGLRRRRGEKASQL